MVLLGLPSCDCLCYISPNEEAGSPYKKPGPSQHPDHSLLELFFHSCHGLPSSSPTSCSESSEELDRNHQTSELGRTLVLIRMRKTRPGEGRV